MEITRSIFDIFSPYVPSLKDTKGTFGVEIETETLSAKDYPPGFLDLTLNDAGTEEYWRTPYMGYWKGVHDGSLRNYGVEFVFQKPLDLAEALVALDQFGQQTKSVKFIADPPGTSVHVHINMLHETPLVMANFLTLLTLYENILIEFSGQTRRSNLFALGMRVAEENRTNIVKLLQAIERGENKAIVFSDSHVKYAAINIATLCKYGSIEIRTFRGTTNSEDIKEWVSILSSIRSFAQTKGLTPRDIIKAEADRGLELMNDVFGKHTDRLRVPGYESLIDRAVWNAGIIATSVKDWATFGSEYKSVPAPRSRRAKAEAVQEWATIQPAQGYSNSLNQLLGLAPQAISVDDLQPFPVEPITTSDTDEDGDLF